MHRVLRNSLFRLAKDDVREFITENEERLIQIFGEELMKGVFAALYRFLDEY